MSLWELRCENSRRLLHLLLYCRCSPASSCSLRLRLAAHSAPGYTALVLLAVFPPPSSLEMSFSLDNTSFWVLSLCTLPSTLCWESTFCCSPCQVPKTHVLQACLSFHAWTCPATPFLCSHTGAQNPISWEVQRFDGWYNNLMEHRWGSKGR